MRCPPRGSLQCSQREYPVDRDHPTHLTSTLQCTDRPSAINSCCFSGCGQHLTCACSDNTVYSMRMPLSLKKTHAFVGESIYYREIHNSILLQDFTESLQHQQKALKVERSLYGLLCTTGLPYKERSTFNAFCQCMTIIVAYQNTMRACTHVYKFDIAM